MRSNTSLYGCVLLWIASRNDKGQVRVIASYQISPRIVK